MTDSLTATSQPHIMILTMLLPMWHLHPVHCHFLFSSILLLLDGTHCTKFFHLVSPILLTHNGTACFGSHTAIDMLQPVQVEAQRTSPTAKVFNLFLYGFYHTDLDCFVCCREVCKVAPTRCALNTASCSRGTGCDEDSVSAGPKTCQYTQQVIGGQGARYDRHRNY